MSARRIFVDGVACRARETNDAAGSVRAFRSTSDAGDDAETPRQERNTSGETSSDAVARVDRRVGERRSKFDGRWGINAAQKSRSMRELRPLLAAALNPRHKPGLRSREDQVESRRACRLPLGGHPSTRVETRQRRRVSEQGAEHDR